MKDAALVYQAGIANVFEVAGGSKVHADERIERRLMQSDFRSCESFARGLLAAGVTVHTFHCNHAGDIARADWSVDLDEAPFRKSFRPVGSFVNPIQN